MPEDTKLQRNNKILIIFIAILSITIPLVASLLISASRKANNDYSKGLLVINTNKSTYFISESVVFNMGSLDSNGKTLCKSNLELIIKTPSGREISLNTKNKEVVYSPTCNENNIINNNPDYQATFVPEEEGKYKITLTNTDTKNSVGTEILVEKRQSSPKEFVIQRSGAIRVNPSNSDKRYFMKLTVSSQKDFKGQLVEKIPVDLVILWQGPSKIVAEKSFNTINWDFDLKAGETKEFIYEYQPSTKELGSFSLGSLYILENGKKVFEEPGLWKVVVGKGF